MRDDAFPRFLDIFNHRFLQLFFRAWADARPIAQHDRPDADRFVTYVGAMIGIGSRALPRSRFGPRRRQAAFAGLMGRRRRSRVAPARASWPACSASMVEIDEFVGSRLVFERERAHAARPPQLRARHRPAGRRQRLQRPGQVPHSSVRGNDWPTTSRFLPTGERCEPLADLVFFYIGEQLEWDVELAIPAGAIEPVRLGRFGQLGWTSWMAPNWSQTERAYRCDARFHPAEIRQAHGGHARPDHIREESTMADISLEAVTGKLNRVGYEAFIQALRHAKGAGNRNVELAHWMLHILQNDAHRHRADGRPFQARPRQAADGPRRRRRRLPQERDRDAGASPITSSTLLDRGWHYATLFFGETQIRTGHLLVGALKIARAAARADRPVAASSARSTSTRSPTSTARSGRSSEEENLRPMDGSGLRGAGTPGAEDGGRRRAAPPRSTASRRTSPPRRRRARWTRSSAATRKSARSSTC